MRITYSYAGKQTTVATEGSVILIGRRNPDFAVDLDFGFDPSISRRHTRLEQIDGAVWVEDAGSTYGTFVNNSLVDGKVRLKPGDTVLIGSTTLSVEPAPEAEPPTVLEPDADAIDTVRDADERPTVFVDPRADQGVPASAEECDISTVIDAEEPPLVHVPNADTAFQSRLSLLFDLPLQFASEAKLDTLLQLVVEKVVDLLPGAERGALLLYDAAKSKYRLRAHVPPGNPAVSESLARRAISEGKGFIWQRGGIGAEVTDSIRRLQMETGMYAPLVWKNQRLGVLCVDNPHREAVFHEEDLRFLLAVAHYAAAAVANQQLQDELTSKSLVLERLLTNFSPKLRMKLLEKARAGQLRPGGEKSEVTILMSDIRGFTTTSAKMDPHDVVEMLNDYFPPLVQAIFQHDGTIDKFVGDAILAVFGSPEPDAYQHEKAVFAALAMQEAMERVNVRRRERGEVTCGIGIGIHSGEVLHGFIGAAERLEFTVIGDTVNRTARYCDGAKPGEVLISPAVFEHAFRSLTADKISIPTKHEGDFEAYRVKGKRV
ncbi:MAG: adenylate/guanylate cyclase domain-containing protein [Verrucomicrobiota bacterium]